MSAAQATADAGRTLSPKPRKPPCPTCGTKLQIKALTDDWGTIFGKWRYCEKCGFDERDADAALAAAKTGGAS